MLKVLEIENVIDCGMSTCGVSLLEGFKQYAGVSDDSRDALMGSLLKSAILKVQEYADRAVVATKLRLDAPESHGELIRLYMGGGDVESVKAEDGTDIDFTQTFDDTIDVSYKGALSVIYTTKPLESDVIALQTVIYRYATALFDGESTDVLNSILNEAL